MSQVRHHRGKTMVVEELVLSTDLSEELEDLKTIFDKPFEYHVYRLSFFTKRFKRKASIESATDRDFIGYAIVVNRIDNPTGKNQSNSVHVYESVIKKSCHAHNFVRGEQEWICSINGCRFKIRGYLYAEQNMVTNVCAHATLRTVSARFVPGGLSYRQISKLAGVSLNNAADGLSSDQIVKVLEAAGARCIVADFVKRKSPPAPFHKYIYGSIESGYPAIVFFGTATSSTSYHVIPVFGHTFNQDT